MKKGGRRAGAGRPEGSTGKRTADFLARLLASGKSPLEVMLDAMREQAPSKPRAPVAGSATLALEEWEQAHRRWRERVLDAAKSAAPYCHPRLTAQINPLDPLAPPVTKMEVTFVSAPPS